ncbi:MAG: PH domain-containing protein [Pseudonocardia sp.]
MTPSDPAPGPPAQPDPPELPWRRLDPRMLAVFPVRQAAALLPLVVVVLIGGRGDGLWQLVGAIAGPTALVALGVLRWLTVRYRVGPERVELRSGLLNRQHRSVRRDRVRTVDLTSSPVHRIFGLTVVEIGTGSQAGKDGGLSLDAVTAVEAERLRRKLLDRAAPGQPVTNTEIDTGIGVRVPGPVGPVARLRASWLRFAPLTGSGLVAVGAVVGTAFQLGGELGVRVTDLDAVVRVGDRLGAAPLWLAVLVVGTAVSLVGALGSLALYLEAWWRYRLTRERDGTLRLRRGFLTTRSLSIEQRRMRGAEVSQSLPLRLFGGARCTAVTTGLDASVGVGGALLPPAPTAEAHRVAAAALCLDDPDLATAATLLRHPGAALRRRLIRAVAPAGMLVAAAWWAARTTPELSPVWPAALLALPLATALGVDRYRNLGHALRPEYLVIGAGSVVRRRVALQRRGIIGWRLRQSLPQRRVGLVTLDAVTAAGRGRYSLVDLPIGWARELIDKVNPGLLGAEPRPSGPARSASAGAEHAAGDLPTQRAGGRAQE